MWLLKVRDQRGQAMVETALVLPIIIMLLYGIFVFGYIFAAQLNLNNAVREGARFAAVGPFPSTATPNATDTATINKVKGDITNKVYNYCVGIDKTKVAVTTKFQGSSTLARFPGGFSEVTATYPVTIHIPFVPYNGAFNIHSTVIIRVE